MKPISKHVLNLLGQKFGRLTVIEFAGHSNLKTALWKCLCDCGNIVTIMSSNLRNRASKSCGCLAYEQQFKTIETASYNVHLGDCKKRDLISFLTKDLYLDIARRPCTYCGEFSTRKNYSTGATLKLNSVDRIYNDPFYTWGTCQSVCFICQKMKNILTHHEFLDHIKKIKPCKPGNNPHQQLKENEIKTNEA